MFSESPGYRTISAEGSLVGSNCVFLLMSVPLRRRTESGFGLNAKGQGTSGVRPQSEGGDPTEGSMLGWLYGNQCQSKALCMSHTGRSQWRRGKGKAGRRRTRGNEKGGWE